jgi:C4-dicarboxylate transporter, DctM subunit
VSAGLVVLLAVAVFLVLLAMEMPVGLSLLTAGGLGLLLLDGESIATGTLGGVPYAATASRSLVVVPMFILMGMLALYANIASQVFNFAGYVMRRIPGGAGVATIATCAGFAAVTGSSVATAATLGKLAVDEMRKIGYPASLAVGIVAAGGTLGVLIPPSIVLVLYGIVTGESIGRLLIAGILPGIVSAGLYMTYIMYKARKIKAPQLDLSTRERKQLRKDSYSGVVKIAVLFTIVVGGIYTGLFTATESGALGAMVVVMMLFAQLRKHSLAEILRNFIDGLRQTVDITSMVFLLIIGASVFSFFMSRAGVPRAFTTWAVGLDIAPVLVLIVLLLAFIPLGMALDSISILLITMPLAYPVITSLGFDGIWFGILVVKMMELGLVTPPVGMNVFVVCGVVKDVPVETGFRGIAPFAVIDVLTICVLFAFPAIVTWLPNLAGLT